MSIATNIEPTNLQCASPPVNPILKQFLKLFQDPQEPPPLRSNSHMHLAPDTKPVNVGLSASTFKKKKKLKIIARMLSTSIICSSTRAFSS